MKEKNIFDILENAENGSMNRLADKCPEISDEQLDRIFVKSEKKFRKMRAGQERTKKENNIKMTENDVVEGVERSKRPAWLTPLSTAASILLIAGIAIGSTVMLKRNTKPNGGGGLTPAITVTTSTGTGTSVISTDKNGSAVTGTSVTTTTTTVTATSASGGNTNTENTADTEFIKPFIGRWRYEMSSINNLQIPESADYMGTVEITSDAAYTMTDNSGNVTHGTIRNFVEEIGGSKVQCLDFSNNEYSTSDFLTSRAYYDESKPYELHFGNGYVARLVREDHVEPADTSWKGAYRGLLIRIINEIGVSYNDPMWDLQDIDGDGIPELLISTGTTQNDYVNIYYYENGRAEGINNTIQVTPFGRYGVTQISKEDHYIGEKTLDEINDEFYQMTRFEDHYPYTVSFSYDHELEEHGEIPYGLDARPVSEEEFNSKVAEFNSKNWITVGRQYYLTNFSPLL
ncbi:hypothetical protein [Ruminococcus flavefaciens]|uniref:hypothetical protein n=1 Tax=Ruminococcus flavefaciens TaxID=1265 RepID=UPI0026EA5F84|nr:hypothetical protein [Ruminococcus flavefaciens]